MECFGAVSHLLSVPGTAVAPRIGPRFYARFSLRFPLWQNHPNNFAIRFTQCLVKQCAYRCSSLFECPRVPQQFLLNLYGLA